MTKLAIPWSRKVRPDARPLNQFLEQKPVLAHVPAIGLRHHGDKLSQIRARSPTEHLLDLGRVTDQHIDLGRTVKSRIDAIANTNAYGRENW